MPRFFVPGLALHAIQRGNDRMPIFRCDDDAMFFRDCLRFASRRHDVAIHAYVLMTNHVHLLATPAVATGLPRMMQQIGRVYVQYFNGKYRRTGTLWEGRYRAAIVENESYLLACMRYIELNPVRAGMVSSPEDYPWSSYYANARGARDDIVNAHELYERLGRSPRERCSAYREMLCDALPTAPLEEIRDATQNGWALGGVAFRQRVTASSRRAERLPRGRVRARRSDEKIDSDPIFGEVESDPTFSV